MIDGLEGETRVILKVPLMPTIGSAFQPTGFPDLGAAEFERPSADGAVDRALLVESVQSLANHFEAVGWDHTQHRPVSTLDQLPYVEVRDADGRFLTSSRLEPHRLAGAYIKNASINGAGGGAWMIERLRVEKGVPLDWRQIYQAIFRLDPFCLLHGVFFSDPEWKAYGNPKVRRAITAVIEAYGARPVVSGGVKRDDVNPTVGEGRGSKEGYGFVPFGRTEYVAERIEMGVAIDLEQIRGYGLAQAETDLLIAAALWEVRALLERPLRLRTACDLVVKSIEVTRPEGWQLPDTGRLASAIEQASVDFEGERVHSAVFT
jgi:CRISPR-associated protein Csb1